MALEIRNAPGRPGYAHLVFDGDIDADPLRIAVYNLMKREYLGQSTLKANWTPARSHFFKATLVERSQGRTTFMIGPEVTTFIPDETMVELTSEDLKVKERAVWNGILLDFHWKGPDSQPDTAKLEDEAAERQRGEKARQEAARSEEEARRAEASMRERERVRLENEALAEQKGVRAHQEQDGVKKGTSSKPRSFTKPLLFATAFILVAGGLVWGALNRDFLCNQFGVLCTEETLAFRKVEACIKPLGCGARLSCVVEYRRNYPQGRYNAEIDRMLSNCRDLDREAYDKAEQCARPLTCGANICISEYRRDYPNGRFKTQIDRIATEKGSACDPVELAMFNRAKACADSKTCGARDCLAEYRGTYPNGPHKAEIDRLDAAKPACLPDSELQMFERAKSCASPMTCGADTCLTEYRLSYPNGRFKAEIDRIAVQKDEACRVLEREDYDRAEQCARPLTCGANICISVYRRVYPNGRFKAEIDRIATEKGEPCPDEREVYQKAEQCSAPLTCGASSCLTEYRRHFPNGRYKSQIDLIQANKGQPCPIVDPLPPFNPRPAGQDAGVNCAQPQNLEPIEQMFCADADLARTNLELKRAWERLPLNRRQSLRAEQRDWIARRDNECNVPRNGSWDQTVLRRLKSCVTDMNRTRTNELQ